jgi:predicted glycosyltransferase
MSRSGLTSVGSRAAPDPTGGVRRSRRPGGARRVKSPGGRTRIAFYSHDTVGLGHARRNLVIARILAAPPVAANALVIAGSTEAHVFPRPRGVDCLTLPAISKGRAGYHSRSLRMSLDEVVRLRSRTIHTALESFEADLLVVDKVPCGAIGELVPALREVRRGGGTLCVLGLRDVLDEPAVVCREWDALRYEEAIGEFYDAVWVYGDANVYDVVREYRLSPDVAKKIHYVGYFDRREPEEVGEATPRHRLLEQLREEPFVLCTVGGGQDGAALARAFAVTRLPEGVHGVILSGPFMPGEARRALYRACARNPRLHLVGVSSDPTQLLRRAARVISMGGYNTVSELVSFEKPALVVPRVSPRREQLIRAERFRQLGLVDVCLPDELSAERLEAWVAGPAPRPSRSRIDLGGRDRVQELALELLPPVESDRPLVAS